MEVATKETTNKTKDQTLVKFVKSPEKNVASKALEILMNRYMVGLKFRVMSRGIDAETARDIVMDSFQKAYENIGTYNMANAFSTWIYKIVDNSVIDYYRRNRIRREKTISIDENPLLKEIPTTPLEVLENKDRVKLINELFDNVDKKAFKQVLYMRYVKQLSYNEISTSLGLQLGTVKSHIFRAKKILKRNNKKEIVL